MNNEINFKSFKSEISPQLFWKNCSRVYVMGLQITGAKHFVSNPVLQFPYLFKI